MLGARGQDIGVLTVPTLFNEFADADFTKLRESVKVLIIIETVSLT